MIEENRLLRLEHENYKKAKEERRKVREKRRHQQAAMDTDEEGMTNDKKRKTASGRCKLQGKKVSDNPDKIIDVKYNSNDVLRVKIFLFVGLVSPNPGGPTPI